MKKLLLLFITICISACASITPPADTPAQLTKELGDLPPIEWQTYNEGSAIIGPLTLQNQAPNMQIDIALLKHLIDVYGTNTTQVPMTLIFLPSPFIGQAENDIGIFGSENSNDKSGLTSTPLDETFVTVGVAVGQASSTSIISYGSIDPSCGNNLEGIDRDAFITLIAIHELFGHGFHRANHEERLSNEECTAQWFERFVLKQLGGRRLVRFL